MLKKLFSKKSKVKLKKRPKRELDKKRRKRSKFV